MLLLYLLPCGVPPSTLPDLHSTMLLLYHKTNRCRIPNYHNLHSTMLLLYLSTTQRRKTESSSFTFHYASTLSYDKLCRLVDATRFTFHYASTLSIGGGLREWWDGLIYIPLCFYFIHETSH